MHKTQNGRRKPAEFLQKDEEQAWRLWCASARRASAAARQRRLEAAQIYWRAAFEIALARMECAANRFFSPVHVLESLSGLVNGFIDSGNWMAARSLANEVADFFRRKNISMDSIAEKLMHAISARISAVQRGHVAGATAVDNIETLPLIPGHQPDTVQQRYVRVT